MEIREPYPAPHERIEARRVDLAAECTDVGPAQIVGHDKKDVRTFGQCTATLAGFARYVATVIKIGGRLFFDRNSVVKRGQETWADKQASIRWRSGFAWRACSPGRACRKR
jgi:hypothetical protein